MTILLVISMVIVFLIIDLFYQKLKFKQIVFSNGKNSIVTAPAASKYGFNELFVPGSFFFAKGHTWVKLSGSGNVKIGIDDFVSKFFGKPERISISPIGKEIKRGDALFTIERDGKKLTFLSPISGTVNSSNSEVLKNPDEIITNPYHHICTIKPEKLSIELKTMKIAEEASDWIKEEMHRLKTFLSVINVENSSIGATLHDGGEPVTGVMEYMDNNVWEKFQKEFLSQ